MGESRRFFRCPMLPEQQNSVLLFGETEVAVRLADMSANGFTAWVSEDSQLKAGDVVQLHAAGSWIPARIVNTGAGTEGKRLGIERLGDQAKVAGGQQTKSRGPWRFVRRMLSDCSSLIVVILVVSGMALAALAVGAGTSEPTSKATAGGSGAKTSASANNKSEAAVPSPPSKSNVYEDFRFGANQGNGRPISRADLPNYFPTTRSQPGVPKFLQPVYDGAAQLVWRIRYSAGTAVTAVMDVFKNLVGQGGQAPKKKSD